MGLILFWANFGAAIRNGLFTEAGSDIGDLHTQIILALIAIVAASVGALVYTIKNNTVLNTSAREVKEINKSVNNIGPGEHTLYVLVNKIIAKQDEFDKRWGNLPEDMDDAVTLSETIHEMKRDHKSLFQQLSRIEKTLEGILERENIRRSGATSNE